MSIILHGSFQGTNFGDTLFLKVFSDYLRKNHLFDEIYATNCSKYAARYCNVKRISKYKALRLNFPIIFCGGGYLGEPPCNKFKWHIRLWKRHLSFGIMVAILNIPYSVLGVGFGPLSFFWTRFPSIYFLKKAHFCALRDAESISILKKYSKECFCIQVADVILSSTADYLHSIAKNQKVIQNFQNTTFLLHVPGDDNDRKIRKVICDIILKLTASKKNINIVVASDYGINKNHDFFEWIPNNLSYVKKVEYKDPSSLLHELINADYILTTKLHVGICSAVLEKKVLSFPKHAKTARLYKQLSRTDVCFPMNELTKEKTERLLFNFINNDIQALKISSEIKVRANKNWELLDSFISQLKEK